MNMRDFDREFGYKLKLRPAHLSKEEVEKAHAVYFKCYKYNDAFLVVAMQEMAELTQCLSKIFQGLESTSSINFLEELADVQICIDNLKIACYISDETFEYAKDVKLEEIKRKLE